MPELETPAETVVQDSAPAELPELSTLSPVERQTWRETGNMPKSRDSAPAKKDAAAPDSAPEKKDKTADSASDSATDTTQKPHLKTKEDSDRRWREMTDENKSLKQRLEALERDRTAAPRESKQESQTAAEVYKPLDEKEFFKTNPKATYEDFVRASGKHEGVWAARQEIAAENQRRAQDDARKQLTSKVEEARKIYGPEYDKRIAPASKALWDDPHIPLPIKAVISDSPIFEHLMFVIGEPAALADLIQTAKTNPAGALRKIVLTEQLVQAELAKRKAGKSDKTDEGKGGDGEGEGDRKRGEDGKFVSEKEPEKKASAAPITKAPKPVSEVGGRGTAPDDAEESAVKAGDMRAAKDAFNRRYIDRHK
jgi:hypothetical protein